jgi:N-acetylmuramoyl-L-alanine amidase
VALLVAILLVGPAGAVEIRAVRLSASPEGTRVVMDLSARTPHSVMTLTNPDRIVIDLSGARLARDARRAPMGTGVVRQVRMAHNASGERIVLAPDIGSWWNSPAEVQTRRCTAPRYRRTMGPRCTTEAP